MRECSINVGSTSDVHMGHPRTPSELISENFKTYILPDNAVTAELDIFFICGDFWDRLLSLPDKDVYVARMLLVYILLVCAKYRIILRILEGTPRHDRKQSKMVQELIDIMRLDIDYKYMDGCQIEYIKSLDINVLYIQDEYGTPESALADFKRLLAEKQLEKVDLACMHGQFEHQLPDVEGARHKCHVAREYLALVRYVIFIGHDHRFSEFRLPEFTSVIIAHGSADRLSHGEEEPKGSIRATIDQKENVNITFVENKGAMDYRTVDVAGLSTDEVMLLIQGLKLRDGSYIRLKGDIFDKGLRMIRHLRKDFPQYRLDPLPIKEKKRQVEEVKSSSTYRPPQISQGNVTALVTDWLVRHGSSEDEVKDCEDHLNEQINSGARRQGTRAVPDLQGYQLGH